MLQPSKAEIEEWMDYVFQHNYNRIEQAAERLGKKGGGFSTTISAKVGEPTSSKYEVPDELAVMEFAIAVKNFALPANQLE